MMHPMEIAQDLRCNAAVVEAFTEYEKFVGRAVRGGHNPDDLKRFIRLYRLELIAAIVTASRQLEPKQ